MAGATLAATPKAAIVATSAMPIHFIIEDPSKPRTLANLSPVPNEANDKQARQGGPVFNQQTRFRPSPFTSDGDDGDAIPSDGRDASPSDGDDDASPSDGDATVASDGDDANALPWSSAVWHPAAPSPQRPD